MEVGEIFKTYPKELKLLLSLIGMDTDSELPTRLSRDYPDMEWDYFLELCMHHRVYPLVYRNIRTYELTIVPEKVVMSLKQESNRNVIKMLCLTQELELVTRLLNDNNIRSLILKGPVLGKELYGDISLRTSKDLDILVPLEDLKNTDEVLRTLGYVNEGAVDLKKRHHTSYYHPEKKLEVEIHWRLEPERGREPSFDELWSRKGTCSFSNFSVDYLGREDLFFSLVSHGFRHGWFRLRWLLDIHFLVQKPIDWRAVEAMLDTYKFRLEFSQTLLLLRELFQTPLESFSIKFVPDRRAIRFAALAANLISGHGRTRYHFSRKKVRHKIDLLIQLLSPRKEDIDLLRLPKALYFLYFVICPIFRVLRRISRIIPRKVRQGYRP
ncbi:nucleotidyltransferase domain-containing protein [Paenibacillus macerans]|uniref:nucleotidyltransferase domain-containing protein n=1 Tax=Paenibacillus macerans TaxID=44252 RepID=UPI003D321811